MFRTEDARELGIPAKQLWAMQRDGLVVRVHPGVYRLTAVSATAVQQLRVALAWAGPDAAAAGRSAGALYRLEGVTSPTPEIVVPESKRARRPSIVVHHSRDRRALMIRVVDGIPTTGVEATLLLLAHLVDQETLEVVCEDARRRRLTSLPALHAYLDRWRQDQLVAELRGALRRAA